MRKFSTSLASAALAVAIAGVANADPITKDLGGGWEVTIFAPDTVDVAVDFVSLTGDVLVIEKTAQFFELATVELLFAQNRDDSETVSQIVITDEILTNNTGVAWTSFTNDLGAVGPALFDVAASASFTIAPFTTTAYAGDLRSVTYSNGIVPDGVIWTPGLDDGGLVIDVDLSDRLTSFTLRETPAPEPSTLAALLIGAGLAFARRR